MILSPISTTTLFLQDFVNMMTMSIMRGNKYRGKYRGKKIVSIGM